MDMPSSSFVASGLYDRRPPDLLGSLFPADQKEIDNESLAAILNGTVSLPRPARIGLLRVDGYDAYWSRSENVMRLDRAKTDELIATLKGCTRVKDAMLIPRLMLPEKRTISTFRETAARCQIDELLIYSSSHEYFRQSKVWGPDEFHGYCRVEAVMLDVRTGVVPFTRIEINDYQTKRQTGDADDWETLRKAEIGATAAGLQNIVADLVRFLDSAP